MKSQYVGRILEGFCRVYGDLKAEGILDDTDLREPVKNNLHSWLQYALMRAGESAGLRSVPEVKMRFSPPLDPKKEFKTNKANRRFSRVDVAFHKSCSIIGIGEVNTINDANVYLSTSRYVNAGMKSSTFTLMDRDVLLYTISQYNLDFVILVVTLPKTVLKVPYSSIWKKVEPERTHELENNKIEEAARPGWKEFKEVIQKRGVSCGLIVINEEGPSPS